MHIVANSAALDPINVLNRDQQHQQQLAELLKPYGIEIENVAEHDAIQGRFFG
jgi:hypothetical protein